MQIVVEHDLSVLDYLSDYVCVLYGQPAVYGVVSLPHSVREGINIFLDGHIPTENLRFRDESLTFRIAEAADQFDNDQTRAFSYPSMEKTMGNFHLKIDEGDFTDSEYVCPVSSVNLLPHRCITRLTTLEQNPCHDGRERYWKDHILSFACWRPEA